MSKLKVSFDFDGTLGVLNIQGFAKKLIKEGIEVHITTSRFDTLDKYTPEFCNKYEIEDLEKEHNYLFKVAKQLGIPKEHIHFTNMVNKIEFFNEYGQEFLFHLDDDEVEIDLLKDCKFVKGIWFSYKNTNWKKMCLDLISAYKFNSINTN
jgi:hypothetical protein